MADELPGAVASANVNAIDRLLAHGADPFQCDAEGVSCLCRAVRNGDEAIFLKLLERVQRLSLPLAYKDEHQKDNSALAYLRGRILPILRAYEWWMACYLLPDFLKFCSGLVTSTFPTVSVWISSSFCNPTILSVWFLVTILMTIREFTDGGHSLKWWLPLLDNLLTRFLLALGAHIFPRVAWLQTASAAMLDEFSTGACLRHMLIVAVIGDLRAAYFRLVLGPGFRFGWDESCERILQTETEKILRGLLRYPGNSQNMMENFLARFRSTEYYRRVAYQILLRVCEEGYTELVDTILDGPGEMNVNKLIRPVALAPWLFSEGETVLQAAAGAGQQRIVETLLNCGAFADGRAAGEMTPLIRAVSSARHQPRESLSAYDQAVTFLIAAGADVNLQDGYGLTALSHAAKNYLPGFVQLLLRHGADPNISNNNGKTPLHYAASFGQSEGMVCDLLRAGAEVNKLDSDNTSALTYACWSGDCLGTVRLLLDYGSDVHAGGGKYGAPINAAAKYANIDIFRAIIDAEADFTPHHYNEEQGLRTRQWSDLCRNPEATI